MFQSSAGTATADCLGEVFAVLEDTSFWQFYPALPADHWKDLLPSGVALGAAPRR